MSLDNNSATKNPSIFLSLFSKKKRLNKNVTESLGNNKKSTGSFLTNGKSNIDTNITHINGNNDLNNSEVLMVPLRSASTGWTEESQSSQVSSFQQQQEQHHKLTKTDLTFPDNKQYCENFNKHQHISINDSLPTQSGNVPNGRSRSESRSMMKGSPVLILPKKANSVGAMNHSDSEYLMEALETLADTQPRVARSIPKHAIIDTSNFAARSLDNCLFDSTVYDAMLHDSLKVCEMLQNHLNQCIVIARTNCPNGFLHTVTEEDEKDAERTFNQKEFDNSTYHSALLTNNTLSSSNK